MTDEQIKKNAEEYILPLKTLPGADENITFIAAIREAYIAGAHSRDEEIKELKWKLAEKSGEVANAIADKVLLKQELGKLSNSWISVNERLPKEDPNNKGYSVDVIGLFSNGNICKCFCSIDEEIWFIGIITSDKPTHWMSIPELKKGE